MIRGNLALAMQGLTVVPTYAGFDLVHGRTPAELDRRDARAQNNRGNVLRLDPGEDLLVAREQLHRLVEIARQQDLQIVAVEADELAQEVDRQQVLPAFLVLLLEDDLGQHRAGDVLAGLGIVAEQR